MAQKKSDQEDFGQLKERLKSGSLTSKDVKRLEKLISQSEGAAGAAGSLGKVGGRPIIARLPGGLDVIK